MKARERERERFVSPLRNKDGMIVHSFHLDRAPREH